MEKSARDGLLKYGEHMINFTRMDSTKITIPCDIPMLEAVDVKPKQLLSEKEALSFVRNGKDTKDIAIHFFAPDYRLDAIYNKIWSGLCARYCPPEFWDRVASQRGKAQTQSYLDRKMDAFDEYLKQLKNFDALCSPDHSVYGDWCHPNNIQNVWRNRLMGQVLAQEGFQIIPTVSWSGVRTYEYAFLGVEPGGTYATSCIGCNAHVASERGGALTDFRNGIKEMVKRLSPTRIIVYGSKQLPDADYGNCDVMFFENQETLRGNKARLDKRNKLKGEE